MPARRSQCRGGSGSRSPCDSSTRRVRAISLFKESRRMPRASARSRCTVGSRCSSRCRSNATKRRCFFVRVLFIPPNLKAAGCGHLPRFLMISKRAWHGRAACVADAARCGLRGSRAAQCRWAMTGVGRRPSRTAIRGSTHTRRCAGASSSAAADAELRNSAGATFARCGGIARNRNSSLELTQQQGGTHHRFANSGATTAPSTRHAPGNAVAPPTA